MNTLLHVAASSTSEKQCYYIVRCLHNVGKILINIQVSVYSPSISANSNLITLTIDYIMNRTVSAKHRSTLRRNFSAPTSCRCCNRLEPCSAMAKAWCFQAWGGWARGGGRYSSPSWGHLATSRRALAISCRSCAGVFKTGHLHVQTTSSFSWIGTWVIRSFTISSRTARSETYFPPSRTKSVC